MTPVAARSTFVWGLQRSGIHLIVGWLYANHGGERRDPLPVTDLHPQLRDGFSDVAAGVAFFNNPGRFHCRRFELGDISAGDFEAAAAWAHRAIFSIEDCALARVSQVPHAEGGADSIPLLRHPPNLVASRLRGAERSPGLFRVDERFVEVLASYCAEALGHTRHLPHAVVLSYDRFVGDRSYRDAIAGRLGLPNRDEISDV